MNNQSVKIGAMYSTLCPNELLLKIAPMFDIAKPTSCELLCQGVNDSYKVTTDNNLYLLRIYRKDWRKESEIEFELSILNHLHIKNVNVAYPINTLSGEKMISIATPEGERFAIMTSFAKGKRMECNDSSEAELYGKSVAKIHKHSESFRTQHARYEIDLKHLIEEPLKRIKPYLKDRESDWLFLKNYISILSNNITKNQTSLLDKGFCHGDFHTGNAYESNGDLTFFDFDCCGFGYRAYDLAVYKWHARLAKKEQVRWKPFIKAYRDIRNISEQDLAVVDDFVSIRHIWVMGLHIEASIDKSWINDAYFTRQITFLKEACDERKIEVCVKES